MSEVRLEPIHPRHAAEIQALVEHDRDIIENTLMPDPYPPDGAEQFIARMDGELERAWVIRTPDGELAGACGLKLHRGIAEIGYWVGAPFRGRGLAVEAARRVVRIAFEELGYTSVRAETRARNLGSRRVLERAGFVLVRERFNGPDGQAKWPAGEPMADYRLDAETA